MLYDVILWDVDDTLLDFEYSMVHALEKTLAEIGVETTKEMIASYSVINKNWWDRLEKGLVTKAQLLPGRFTDFFEVYDIDCPDINGFLAHYQENLGMFYRINDDSLAICKTLKGKCKQCVVTNGVTSTQLKKLKLSGFYDVMDDVFISEHLGAPKPSKTFFDRVLETMPDIEKNRILIVGDSLSSDMLGGNNAGIDTCWYNPYNKQNDTAVEIKYTIRNLKEVPMIVEG